MKNIRFYEDLGALLKAKNNTTNRLFVLVAEKSNFNYDELLNVTFDFCGAVVPQVIFDGKNYEKGIVVAELEDYSEFLLIEDMSNFNLKEEIFKNKKSFIVMLDGLSSNITNFLENIFEYIPTGSSIIGSGAGKLTLKQEPVIFSKDGIFQNAAIVISKADKINIGVENGWTFLEGPFIVTDCSKNILKSLNFKNAFDVYKNIVEKDSGLKFNNDNFFDIAKSYPLGIVKFDKDIVVRDPIAIDENGNMILVGDIEKNSTINVLKGVKEELIASAKKAVTKITDKNELNKNALIFDCISRCIYLESDYQKELDNIKSEIPNKNLFGALTLGEISNHGDEYIYFYNKTCVVGL